MENSNKRSPFMIVFTITIFLFAIIGASYAYYASSIGSSTGASNIANALINMPTNCTFTASSTGNCSLMGDYHADVNLADSYISAGELMDAYDNTLVASTSCGIDVTINGNQGCYCNYKVVLVNNGTAYSPSSAGLYNLEYTAEIVKESALPSGYTELEYIQGGGVIDTGYVPNGNTRVYADFALTDLSGGITIFGVRNASAGTSTSNAFTFIKGSNSKWAVAYGSNNNNSLGNPDTNRHTIDMNKGQAIFDDSVFTNYSTQSFTAIGSMLIFNGRNGTCGTCFISSTTASMKLYDFIIYENDVQVHHYVPCKNNSNVVGLYDILTDQFLSAAGGGFTAGPSLSVGSGYGHYERLESNGNQYINTGVIPSSTTRFAVDMNILNLVPGTYSLFGTEASGKNFSVSTSGELNKLIIKYGSLTSTVDLGQSYNGRHTFELDQNIFKIDGRVVFTFSAQSFTATTPIYVLSINGANSLSVPVSAVLYGAKAYTDGFLSYNFIPVQSSSRPFNQGLYDTITGSFKTSASGTSFVNNLSGYLTHAKNTIVSETNINNLSSNTFIKKLMVSTTNSAKTDRYIANIRWYNLPISQTSHYGKSYKYDLKAIVTECNGHQY